MFNFLFGKVYITVKLKNICPSIANFIETHTQAAHSDNDKNKKQFAQNEKDTEYSTINKLQNCNLRLFDGFRCFYTLKPKSLCQNEKSLEKHLNFGSTIFATFLSIVINIFHKNL